MKIWRAFIKAVERFLTADTPLHWTGQQPVQPTRPLHRVDQPPPPPPRQREHQ